MFFACCPAPGSSEARTAHRKTGAASPGDDAIPFSQGPSPARTVHRQPGAASPGDIGPLLIKGPTPPAGHAVAQRAKAEGPPTLRLSWIVKSTSGWAARGTHPRGTRRAWSPPHAARSCLGGDRHYARQGVAASDRAPGDGHPLRRPLRTSVRGGHRRAALPPAGGRILPGFPSSLTRINPCPFRLGRGSIATMFKMAHRTD